MGLIVNAIEVHDSAGRYKLRWSNDYAANEVTGGSRDQLWVISSCGFFSFSMDLGQNAC